MQGNNKKGEEPKATVAIALMEVGEFGAQTSEKKEIYKLAINENSYLNLFFLFFMNPKNKNAKNNYCFLFIVFKLTVLKISFSKTIDKNRNKQNFFVL